jgi:hypothetical protein
VDRANELIRAKLGLETFHHAQIGYHVGVKAGMVRNVVAAESMAAVEE